eukprot:scaffold16308_cov55-Attheya_sp.AAC.1
MRNSFLAPLSSDDNAGEIYGYDQQQLRQKPSQNDSDDTIAIDLSVLCNRKVRSSQAFDEEHAEIKGGARREKTSFLFQ